jgi:hypothetical protein
VDRAVRFDLILNSRKYVSGGKDAVRTNQQITESTKRAGNAFKAVTAAFSVGVVVTQMRNWVAAARDSNRVAAQTAAVIKSTHGAAGLSAKGFSDLAKSIEKTTAVDDDLIQGGEAIIATFTNIHGDVFKKTTQAAVDLAAGMNHGAVTAEGLQTASIQLGKALQDPIKGVTALQRIGIKLSDQQKAQIATFVKNGQVAKAQGVILAEVNRQFAGSAAAAVTPAKRLAQQWGDMQEVLGNLLIPAIDRGAQILSSILGVVDRNRTAFGVLFGVLGTGAAIIGTLVVAEKIHKATTEGIQAVTKAWEGAQKGLNLVLGLTRAQALTTAAAEDALAASTTAAGTAAAGASASVGAGGLAGGLRTVAGAAAGPLTALAGLAAGFGLARQSIKDNVSMWDEFRHNVLHQSVPAIDQAREAANKHAGATKGDTLATAYNATQQQALRLQMAQLVPGIDAAADATNKAAAAQAEAGKKITDLKSRIQGLKDEYKQAFDSIVQSIENYQGSLTDSKNTSFVTTKSILQDLHNQVGNFKTYSRDIHTLIKAGFSTEAIKELQDKGPQYVHGMAVGSKAQLADYKKTWLARNKEIKGNFATAMDEQFAKLKKQIRNMQREIDTLRGKNISVSASLKLSFSKSFTQKDWAQVKVLTRGARGMLITQGTGPTADDVPALVSKGETIVSARDSADPAFRTWAKARRIKGYAAGGAIGTIGREAGDINRLQGKGTGIWMDRGITQIMKAFTTAPGIGASASVTSVANWTARILGRIAEAGAWARRIMFESGGNWTAVNRTDSNWFAGHPSVGGAQVIRGTFNAYAGRFRGTGPYLYGVSVNPWANSYAGANYAVHRYGSMAAVDPRVRPIGYARGGLVMDHGGFLTPGWNPPIYNGTGRPEPVGQAQQHVTIIQVDRRVLARIVNDGGLLNARLT